MLERLGGEPEGPASENQLPFTIIDGYLGAGKITLLNHLLANTAGLRLAVLVNDYGSVNIDVELILSHKGDTINLANGCMCCSLVSGFAAAIGQIRNQAGDFDHVVIETSGVADPGKIAQYGQMYELPLDGIILVVDAELVRIQASNKYVGDTVLRQLSQADLIVLNKTDLVSAGDLASLRTWLTGQAPGTPLIETVHSEVPIDVLLGAHGRSTAPMAMPAAAHPEDHLHTHGTWTIERAEPLSRQAIDRFASGLGGDIYRAKGFVFLKDDPQPRYIYQQVGAAGRWSQARPGVKTGAAAFWRSSAAPAPPAPRRLPRSSKAMAHPFFWTKNNKLSSPGHWDLESINE
jgi:G3E family GTPase